MYRVRVEAQFCAAHKIIGHQDKCSKLHGHNWNVEVIVSNDKLNKSGMIIDFDELKEWTKKVIEPLDHQNLNELKPFSNSSPTAEAIAQYLYLELQKLLSQVKLEEVKVWETPTCWASYSRQDFYGGE
ncbi:MAG: 6-carboxytetrahydropterin synthase QueD [bacterium]